MVAVSVKRRHGRPGCFARLPSLVNLGLVIAIAFYGYLSKTPFKKIVIQVIWFAAGFRIVSNGGHFTD